MVHPHASPTPTRLTTARVIKIRSALLTLFLTFPVFTAFTLNDVPCVHPQWLTVGELVDLDRAGFFIYVNIIIFTYFIISLR